MRSVVAIALSLAVLPVAAQGFTPRLSTATQSSEAPRPAIPGSLAEREDVQAFIDEMATRHGMDRHWLLTVFGAAQARPEIIEIMNRPAEAKPWHAYRRIFLTDRRIAQGQAFWRTHAATLKRAQATYGVDPQIIVAILGVETSYGDNTGGFKVLEALSTLAFDYPRRAPFFRSELEHFLLIAREEGRDPLTMKGSYAGAMGLAQFMPSSYRAYAVDFDGDGHRDLWENPVDAIGSIANYLAEHRWNRGDLIAAPAQVSGNAFYGAVSPRSNLKLNYRYDELARLGVEAAAPVDAGAPAMLLAYETEAGQEYWLGFTNFYAITRYNRSPLYALAVVQLGQAIQQGVVG